MYFVGKGNIGGRDGVNSEGCTGVVPEPAGKGKGLY